MQAVTAILILGAIASLVAWVILLLLEHGIRPVHSMVHFVRRLPWSGRLAVLPLFIALVVVGSTKFSGNNVSDGNNLQMTNAVEGVVSGGFAVGRQDAPVTNSESDMPNSEQESIGATADEVTSSGSAGAETQIQLPVNDGEIAVPDSITALDCEAGFVLSGVGYGEEFDFAPPENAVVCDDWLRFGAHEDWLHLPLGWFAFPFGSNIVNALTAIQHIQYIQLEAFALAVFALQHHIRHKLHLYPYRSLALAGFAPTSWRVKREMRRREAHLFAQLLLCV